MDISAKSEQPENSVSRRAMLALTTGAALAATATAAASQDVHDHGAHDHHGSHDHAETAVHKALIDAALDCVNTGEVCVSHCISSLGSGDTTLKDCLKAVLVMMPAVSGLARLAALDASRLREFAKVCGDICADCQAECKKHQDHHAACKACGEACGKCVEECRKLV